MPKPWTYLDLFCGCGGFSLGFERAGFHPLCAIDFDPVAIETFKINLPNVPITLCQDITKINPSAIGELIPCHPDVIIGSPPCQSFSTAKNLNDSISSKCDHRSYLYRDFLRFVDYFKPLVFIMENIQGILREELVERTTIEQIIKETQAMGYRVSINTICASRYGAPQYRKRIFIVGSRRDITTFCDVEYYHPPTHATCEKEESTSPELFPELSKMESPVTLLEAIGDLPILDLDNQPRERDYDSHLRHKHICRFGSRFLYNTLEIEHSSRLTMHVSPRISEKFVRDCEKLRQGEYNPAALKRGINFAIKRFNLSVNAIKRLREDESGPTVTTHDSNPIIYIHPTQNRLLSIRERARLQTFPDWFIFPRSMQVAKRLIGNAVPCILGEAIGRAIARYLVVI